MILVLLITIPLLGGLAAWISDSKKTDLPRWIALSALGFDLVLVLVLWTLPDVQFPASNGNWFIELNRPWVPALGISLHLAIDGLSLILIALTVLLGIVSIICSWSEIRERIGFFHMNLLLIISGILGVFLALDLFLVIFFWELMLVPMYFLIILWGHENRHYAALKFFLFTQAGGLLMFLSILALYFVHGRNTGTYTFDYNLLLGTILTPLESFWIMMGFVLAFIVKLPVVPFHPWLPDAHTEAPTAGSVILAGLLLKTGAYGLLRFAWPLFPDAMALISQAMLVLAVIGIIYGALLAFGQTDLKRLVAYTSISHMGFVLFGIFAGNEISGSGAVFQMLAHGISTGALFIIIGIIQERLHTRELDRMGGVWSLAPNLGGMGLFFALASLGLPGLANFVAEFMVLLGAYGEHRILTAIAACGLVLAAIYSLWIVQRVFHGRSSEGLTFADLSKREAGTLATMAMLLLWLGLYPGPVLNRVEPVLRGMYDPASTQKPAAVQRGTQ